MNTKRNMLRIGNCIALFVTVLINFLANALPLGGYNTGQISAMYPTLFTPPGFTFAIWAGIYSMLTIVMILQFIPKYEHIVEDMGIFFIISCMLNIGWIFTWHYQLVEFATIIIVGLLLTLIMIYRQTRDSVSIAKMTFSTYYAWITVATIISIFVAVKTLTGGAPVTPIEPRILTRFSDMLPGSTDILLIGGNPEIVSYVTVAEYIAATFAVIITALVTIWHFMRFEDYAYVATILWAVGGIMYRQMTAVKQPVYMLIAAALGVAGILVFMIWKIDKKLYLRKTISYK